MAFPIVENTNSSARGINGTSHIVNLPASIVSGQLLLIFFNVVNTSISTPTNWTLLGDIGGSSSIPKLAVFYKIADGSEGSTVTITTGVNRKSAHISFSISGYDGNPFISSGATGTNTSPNPDSLTPGLGARDYLWIALTGWQQDLGGVNLSAYPSNYSDNQLNILSGGSGDHPGVGVATRDLNASSEDPGNFTLSAGSPTLSGWNAITVSVSPPASGGGNTSAFFQLF